MILRCVIDRNISGFSGGLFGFAKANNLMGMHSFRAVEQLKLYDLAGAECFESFVGDNLRIMHKNIRPIFRMKNEAVSFLCVKPFNGTLLNCHEIPP